MSPPPLCALPPHAQTADRQPDVGRKVYYFLATGNLVSSTGLDLMQVSGYTVVAEKLNFLRYLSHFRAVHRGQFFRYGGARGGGGTLRRSPRRVAISRPQCLDRRAWLHSAPGSPRRANRASLPCRPRLVSPPRAVR